MLLKLPASSGKTGVMRAKSGSRSGDLDISGGYETVKCTPGVPFPQFATALRSGTVPTSRSSFAQWNRYNSPASPCLRWGKGQPLREEKGEPL
jgi:hypothetical protein